MTLKEFVIKTKSDLDFFEEWWIENNKNTPKEFPIELGEGDWLEQFHFFDTDLMK